ncbi:MAG: tyrosine-protein phosphatase [Desulfovibrio sp.]|jgi:protein tyrosine phosphatase (PTP) superfamily phosphohydrolase (DUF442 family)|nr:tyrosine-protein phosphatase [Desulfovibrio sp.]
MRRQGLLPFLFLLLAFFLACGPTLGRDPSWAVPVDLEGVPNLHRVTEDLYRSGQPSAEGFRNLEAIGVRTVVNLRDLHRDDLQGTALRGIRVRMRAWDPDINEVLYALQTLSNKENAPILVHCQHGADRTGLVVAVYRMAVQDWSRERAIDEMMNGGYGFHPIWADIPRFLRQADIAAIKAALKGRSGGAARRGLFPGQPGQKDAWTTAARRGIR